MAAEYVVAGRRPLPGGLFRWGTWSWTFSFEDTRSEDDEGYDHDAPMFDEGSLAIDEIKRRGNAAFFAVAERRVGFSPRSIVTVRKAGWDFSRAAAEVVAAALDGVVFVDAGEGILPAVEATAPAGSIEELQARIVAASRDPGTFFERWEAEEG